MSSCRKLHDANDAFVHLLQSFAVLVSGVLCPLRRPDDAESDDKTASQCDEELRTLPLFQKALERRVPLVCQKRNTFPWINTLPPELLVDIFAIATATATARYLDAASSNNATLLLVCRYWNRLVDTAPSLWTKIEGAMGSEAQIIRAIEKSRNAPLEIAFEQETRNAALDEIFRHAHHWRDVTLAVKNADQGLDVITTSSMPLLDHLSLSVDRWSGWVRPEPLDLFGGRPPPRLRKLCLKVVPVPWSPTTLCNLTSLSMSLIRHLGPSLDQLIAVLSACPDLESLSISEVSFSGDTSASSPHPIHLPALATLALDTLTPAITNRLLASIRAPNYISGTLRCYIQGDPLQTLFTSDVSHFFDCTRSNPSTGHISCLGDDRFGMSVTGPWFINIYVENITFAKDTLIWLSAQSRVLLRTRHLYQPLGEIVAAVADMEGVYSIELGYGDPVSEALTLLATCSLVQGRTRWPFPELEEISMQSDLVGDELEKLLLLLRRRKEAQKTEDNGQHPKRIRRLELGAALYASESDSRIFTFSSIYWPNRLDEVRRLLGPEGELIWYGGVVTEEGSLEGLSWV